MRSLVLGLAACAASFAACDEDEDTPKACVVDGVEHAVGASFPSADGCNTCTCGADLSVACTLRACATPCVYAGVERQPGSSFPAGDGCNTCNCAADGTVACTEIACAVTCQYDGKTWNAGDSFPATDGCNTCSCGQDGQVLCTLMPCISGCLYEGQSHEVGDSFPASDGCNTCTCMEGGQVACTDMACIETCTYDRQTWAVGDTFPAIDGCNTCTCMEGGQIACTEIACPVCDAASEWWRQYFGHSVEECAAIDFRCLEWTTMFNNDCGCGCEQSADCAQEIDCFWPECENAGQLAVQCPYSTIDQSRDCSAELACPPDAGFCTRPDQDLGCGICQNPPEEATCAGDEACEAGSICEPLRCACAGQMVCVPGCTSDGECKEGEVCGGGGRCAAQRCGAADDCPANFRCDGGGCLRMSCAASETCAGYCVEGSCYAEPGSCMFPPP